MKTEAAMARLERMHAACCGGVFVFAERGGGDDREAAAFWCLVVTVCKH